VSLKINNVELQMLIGSGWEWRGMETRWFFFVEVFVRGWGTGIWEIIKIYKNTRITRKFYGISRNQ
jgi:hypothetical protein